MQWTNACCSIVLVFLGVIHLAKQTIKVKGAGASFPLDVYTSWIPAYETYRRRFQDVDISYRSIGSGKGKASIKGELEPQVDYAGSDSLLSPQDYEDYPDLQMFPTMAGAVVCVFNLPGISHLNMTMQQLAGIYSGSITWWNDSSLAEINPQVTLPNEKIITTARRDRSGTTEIFTRTLSSFDSNWKNTYGTFSGGTDEQDNPVNWNASAIRVFGLTNRGLAGMILSTRYSIGYLVMSEVTSTKLSYALLQNNASHFVAPTMTTVQNAMVATSLRFDNRMTASLSNPSGKESYPMAGYTYFIIRMSNASHCNIAKELVRYIEWFFTNPMARNYCSDAGMVPLHYDLYQVILNEIIFKVTCNNHNVYRLVLVDIKRELDSLRTWVIPVYIITPLFGVVVLIAAGCLINKKTKTYRAVWNHEWKIEPWEINFYHVSPRKISIKTGKFMRFTRNKIYPSETNGKSFSNTSKLTCSRLGEWQGHLVYLKALAINKNLTFNRKKMVLWMGQTLRHKNLTRFYGLVDLDGVYHSVMEYNTKGSLSNFLHKSNLNSSIDIKFAISYELACGMNFLHKNNIVHGSLSSSNCYFDSNWSLRVDEWARDKLEDRADRQYTTEDIINISQWDAPEFWTAPEILQGKTLPTKSGDVYSFGIIMKEIFTRDLPFAEYSSCRTPGEVLRDVIDVSLRPGFCLTTPFTARAIMSKSWESDPGARASFLIIQDKIMKTYSRGKAVVDSIIHLLEEYVTSLEETIETIEARAHIAMDHDLTNCTSMQVLPSSEKIQPQKLSSVTVVVCNICDFMAFPSRYSSTEIVQMLTNLFQAFDDITMENQLYTFDVTYNCYKMVAGLPKPNTTHAQTAVQSAFDFTEMAQRIHVDLNTYETLRLKIGISSGSVFLSGSAVGTYTEKRFMCGDAVFVASQLAEEAPSKTILISQMTEELLQPSVKWNVVPRTDPFVWKGALMKTYLLHTNNNLFNLTTV